MEQEEEEEGIFDHRGCANKHTADSAIRWSLTGHSVATHIAMGNGEDDLANYFYFLSILSFGLF